jgi:hypothetical protein
MKVIFLDIDGVLVTSETLQRKNKTRHFCEKAVAQLNRILQETDAEIVLSSSWRIGASLSKLNSHFFDEGVAKPIVDFTPNIMNKSESGLYLGVERKEEIKSWLANHLEVSNFVVIDDDWDARIENHFVKTSIFQKGLTERLADKAIKILNKKYAVAEI